MNKCSRIIYFNTFQYKVDTLKSIVFCKHYIKLKSYTFL